MKIIFLTIENKKPFETVYELKEEYKIPSFEEFMKTYEEGVNYDDLNSSDISEARGYGPCPDIWNESGSAHKFDNGFEALSVSTEGRIEAGVDKRAYASAGGDLSAFRYRDHLGDLKLFNYSANAEAGIGENGASAKYKLGVDVANVKVKGVSANVGVDVGSEASIGEGSVKAKVAGLGFSFGKEMGISTPFGGISINLEESAGDKCVIQ